MSTSRPVLTVTVQAVTISYYKYFTAAARVGTGRDRRGECSRCQGCLAVCSLAGDCSLSGLSRSCQHQLCRADHERRHWPLYSRLRFRRRRVLSHLRRPGSPIQHHFGKSWRPALAVTYHADLGRGLAVHDLRARRIQLLCHARPPWPRRSRPVPGRRILLVDLVSVRVPRAHRWILLAVDTALHSDRCTGFRPYPWP